MSPRGNRPVFLLIFFLAIATFSISLYDLITNQGWIQHVFAGYMILILLTLVIMVLTVEKKQDETIKKFTKTLKGRLYHFQCPRCQNIFAMKKSKKNNKNPVKLTCPACGEIANIPPVPKSIRAEIPEKKSYNITFECNVCNETVTLWAEGTSLYENIHVFSCPYCGTERSMNPV